MRTDFRSRESLADQTLENWLQCTAWLRLWHSAETHAFHAGLHATAEFLVDLLKLATKSAKRNAAEVSFSVRKVMEIAIKFLIETHRFMEFLTSDIGLSAVESESLKCLLDPTASPKDKDRREIWRSGSPLLECLKTLKEVFDVLDGSHHSQEMEELMDRRANLEKALNWTKPKGAANSVEHQFRSEIGHLKLFPYDTPLVASALDQRENVRMTAPKEQWTTPQQHPQSRSTRPTNGRCIRSRNDFWTILNSGLTSTRVIELGNRPLNRLTSS
jgi:hypothetical protein